MGGKNQNINGGGEQERQYRGSGGLGLKINLRKGQSRHFVKSIDYRKRSTLTFFMRSKHLF